MHVDQMSMLFLTETSDLGYAASGEKKDGRKEVRKDVHICSFE